MQNKKSSPSDVSWELSNAPIGRLLLKLSIPTIAAQLVNILYNIVDRIYIGHMSNIGDLALTGVGLCFPVVHLLTAFALLIGQGGAPRAAISMGKGDDNEAEKILGNCFAMLVAVSVFLTVMFQVWGEDLLWFFGASENTIQYALPYMQIYTGGSIFFMFTLGLNLFITTQGYTRYSMITVLIGAVSNIILDPIFIFEWGFGLGVAGAAIATVISQMISAAFVIAFLLGRKTKLHIKRIYLLPQLKVILPILALGLAPFIMNSTEAILNVSFNSSLQRYGGDVAVGSMTIATTLLTMVWLLAQGIGQGAQPIISYNYGARNVARVKKAVKVMFNATMIFTVVCWVVIECFPQVFIKIFNDSSQELLDTATWTLRLYMASLGLFGMLMSVQQILLAIGKAKASLFIAVLRKIILLIPLIFILPNFFDNKVFAVFLAEPISDFISNIVSLIIFSVVFTKSMKQLEEEKIKRNIC
ncbi:MAG: MATE family efflux transporter [Eubacteriales bacterium]